MRKFTDESGWVRAAVCFAALLTHHGIRDSLLTALPTIAAADDQTSPGTTEIPAILNPTHPQASPLSSSNLSRGSQEYDNFTRSYDVAKSANLTTPETPANLSPTDPQASPPSPSNLSRGFQKYNLTRSYDVGESANLSPNTQHSTETTLGRGKQGERLFEGRGIDGVVVNTPPPPVFQSLAGTEIGVSDAVEVTGPSSPSSSSVSDPTVSHEAWEKLKTEREESDHSTVINEAWETSEARGKKTDYATVFHEPHREESDHSTSHETWKTSEHKEKLTDHSKVSFEAKTEKSNQSGLSRVPAAVPSFRRRTSTDEGIRVGDGVPKKDHRGENVIPRPPLYLLRGGKGANLHLEEVEAVRSEPSTRRRERSIEGHLTEMESNPTHNLVDIGSRHVQDKNRKSITAKSGVYEEVKAVKSEPSTRRRERSTEVESHAILKFVHSGSRHVQDKNGKTGTRTPTAYEDLGHQLQEEEDLEERQARTSSVEGHEFKEDWTLFLEGVVLSSVFWGWLFSSLLADTLMDKVGVVRVLALSQGLAGLFGLLTHAISLAGPWALLALRIVQGAVQGVSYPAVVRVLEGVPSSGRAAMAVLVYMGPALGTGVGAGLGSLPQWYAAPYVMGSLAVALTPLCLLLPKPPVEAPHKETQWRQVLGCRGVWACVGVHLANSWMLHTLLLGLPLCLTYTHLDQPGAGGWVVAVAALVVGVEVRVDLFLASKLSMKRPLTVLTRRRTPVVLGTILVVAALITMSTAGLDSAEVLVGVGVGLAGVGLGVVRMGYRLNLDDMAPLGAWRVTRVLDVVAVVAAAACPLAVCGLAEAGHSGWVGVWLVPLCALIPASVAYLFLLTSNQQPWDQKGDANGGVPNGAAGGVPVSPVNGVGPAASSVGRQSFKSARSNLTFKTARSRSRTRTVSCHTVDEDLDGDMRSAVGTNSVECRSVVDEADPECVSVASSSTFKSDGADMHSVIDDAGGTSTPGKQQPGQKFGSMLVNGGTTDRTTAWLSSHHDLVLEAEQTPTRAGTHAANAIYGLLW
ncbi:uncharacterized protein LOC127002238 isoform X2 [Eriocheir sinensis]|uniref:uncharacterized protein LOC127002238 isoform X2 n=1 Tax=Eriocheir sinensis TaxID=95602 RepID=UPI0021CA35E3|nr:uncharacterized protein LOC127002238 isoform X2 [Eriocheir sinensis]